MNVISLGWGVQSFALAAMSALGELEPAIAIHSDTRREREETYTFAAKWTEWLEARGVKVITVTAADSAHRLYPYSNSVFMPAYTLADGVVFDWEDEDRPRPIGKTKTAGQLRRQCTSRWKVDPLIKKTRELAGNDPVSMWLGISWDEMHRAKPARETGMINRWPLIEKRMARSHCEEWLTRNGLEIPVKSACWSCPLHSTQSWRSLSPADREKAIALDEQLRKARPNMETFLSAKRVPLTQVYAGIEAQADMFEFENDSCESGHCFV